MALANANVIAWDFKAASTPLASKVGQAETFTLNFGSIDTTDGAKLRGDGHHLILQCTNGGYLTGWSRPYTYVVVSKINTALSGSGGTFRYCYRRDTSNNRFFGADGDSSTRNMKTIRYDDGWNISDITTAFTDNTLEVFVIEVRNNGAEVWRNGSSIGSGSSTTRNPTFNTTDHIILGSTDGFAPKMDVHALALVPGTLSNGDLALMNPTDYYNAIFGTSSTVAKGTLAFFLNES